MTCLDEPPAFARAWREETNWRRLGLCKSEISASSIGSPTKLQTQAAPQLGESPPKMNLLHGRPRFAPPFFFSGPNLRGIEISAVPRQKTGRAGPSSSTLPFIADFSDVLHNLIAGAPAATAVDKMRATVRPFCGIQLRDGRGQFA